MYYAVNDAVILLRDIAGDSAQNAANVLRPGEDQLNQIDHAAEDNTWHDVPNMSDLRTQAKDQYAKNKPFGRDEAKNATLDNQTADGGVDGQATAQRLGDQVPEHQKQKARETWDKTRGYMDKKMPKERREQTIWRLKKMIVEIQGHQDCKFLDMVSIIPKWSLTCPLVRPTCR